MNKKLENILTELVESDIKTEKDLHALKRKISKKHKINCPKNIQLLKKYHELLENKRIKRSLDLEMLFRTRPIRSLSGIVNVSVLTKNYPCPGKCVYCPTQNKIPKSYLKKEPAVQRAILTNFNPYQQVVTRIKSLKKTGHPVDKIDLRIIGGTWSFYEKRYQTWFIKECFKAANSFSSRKKTTSLRDAQAINEKAKCKIIGITIETRPDFITKEEIKRLRKLGVTRVELGIQSLYEDVLKITKRGHGVKAIINSTRLLKDSGFKVSYQIMPNLPGSNFKKDVLMFKIMFENSDFRPDLLKIYPLALVKKSILYNWYKKGKFKPYTQKELVKLLIEIKKTIPYYCRIHRVIRDIPAKYIVEGGSKTSNLREIVLKEMKKRGLFCKCIRCRETKEKFQKKIFLFREEYTSSQGKDIFLSYENEERKQIYALLRLRIPFDKKPVFTTLKKSGIIREIHTYGQMVPIGEKGTFTQHRGLGKRLIKEAEKITKEEFKLNKIAVISGVGVRDYFRKIGYRLKDSYLVKIINKNPRRYKINIEDTKERR